MCETCQTLGAALEIGRIAASEVGAWKRAFELDEGAARRLLEGREPNEHRRLENRHAIVTARPADLTDELVKAHELDLVARMGLNAEALI
jgi:hypothetical protein